MKLSPQGLEFIKSFEGFQETPYYCPGGYLTVAYGHLVRPGENFANVSEQQGLDILLQDVKNAENAIYRLVDVPLTQSQFDALCSFTFNLGSAALQRSTLRRKINRYEFEEAADEFCRWTRAGNRILRGLIIRRQQERLLFLSGTT